MLVSEDTVFEKALAELSMLIDIAPTVPIMPLPCDRWIARSCLQKSIRRAEPELAQRALANLFEYDRRATWRHLVIIALEDVGVANVDVLARIVAAQRNRQWRQDRGGDWRVMAELVRQMAVSNHCQAACDLLLRALNDPNVAGDRGSALEQDPATLAQRLWNLSETIETKAIAAMALGGGLADGQQLNDPCAVFDIFADSGLSSDVVATCRTAWKISRNPMALLLPLVWEHWIAISDHRIASDAWPPVQMLGDVPGYSLDQFTRVGNDISRALLKADVSLQDLLRGAGFPPYAQPRAVGDLIFLTEGGSLANRMVWKIGDELRVPHRALPTIHQLGSNLAVTLRYIDDKAGVIAKLRARHLPSAASRGRA